MKRGRISNAKRGRKKSGPNSFFDLPRYILLNFLLRLPVKSILVSKCVCKSWYDLISDPEFAKLHFDQSEVYPLIKKSGSRMVYLMQPDKADFELKLGMCDHTFSKPGCVCNVHVKLDTKFKIPDTYGIINSCNGLLYMVSNNNPPIVCNPITGEFINLHVLQEDKKYDWVRVKNYGFGFSPASNQYKVIRMSRCQRGNQVGSMAEVHLLGTKTRKNIGRCVKPIPEASPTYLNGFLYWSSGRRTLSLISFDIRRECFELVPAPTTDKPCKSYTVGILGGELCISGVLKSGAIHVWTMKDNGTEKAWSKVFFFYLNSFETRNYGSFQPIQYLNDVALLMFDSHTNAFIYMDPKTNRMRFLKVRGCEKKSLIAHIPSFVSLKHALSGQNVKVLNVKPRCAELKLQGEVKDIYLVEEELYPVPDFDYNSDSSSDSGFSIESYFSFDSDYDSGSDSDSDSDSESSSENEMEIV